MLNYALSGHSTLDNQPGHQLEVEVRDPAGGFAHFGLLPGNVQSWLNEANKLYADTSAKRSADIVSFLTGRLSAPVSLGLEAAQAAGARSSLQMPYAVGKAGVAGLLERLAPIGIQQVAQGAEEGGVNPLVASALAVLGLNPRYTNPNTPSGTAGGGGGGGNLTNVPRVAPPVERTQPVERTAPTVERVAPAVPR